MSNRLVNRREWLASTARISLGASVALEQLAGVPMLGTLSSKWLESGLMNRFDAYAMMGNALRGGAAFLKVQEAMAAAANDWSIVQIKVLNHVHTPLVFRLGELSNNIVTTDASIPLASARTGRATAALTSLGVDSISNRPRYRNLRFNEWFANILHHGTSDGRPMESQNRLGLAANDIAPLDDDKVAIQAFVGLSQIQSNNHSLKGTKLRSSLPDITLFLEQNQLITSPLGISCFMMGGNYDKAEGALAFNAVLGADNEVAVVASRTVADYVGQISQFVGKSYVDRRAIESANLTYQFDQLVDKDPKLRRELLGSLQDFKASLTNLEAAATLENARQTLNIAVGNTQADPSSELGASMEFLAQCKYVTQSLNLPGQPVRNFSLFLNVSDLDGQDLDRGFNGGAGTQVKAYSYIEGMRQLGMGLNMLARSIATGKKIIVIVHSEGGRNSSLGDSKTSFALVLGPKGSNYLDDCFYGNMAAINTKSSGFLRDPGGDNASMPWDLADALKEKDGTDAVGGIPSTGDVGMGVVDFLEEKTGILVRKTLSAAEARFVKLKRG